MLAITKRKERKKTRQKTEIKLLKAKLKSMKKNITRLKKKHIKNNIIFAGLHIQ